MGMPSFIKKKIEAKEAAAEEEDPKKEAAEGEEEEASTPKPKGKVKTNALMAWMQKK